MAKKKPATGRGPGRPATGQTPMLYLRVPEEDRQLWLQAAKQSGQTLSAWMRDHLSKIARRALRK